MGGGARYLINVVVLATNRRKYCTLYFIEIMVLITQQVVLHQLILRDRENGSIAQGWLVKNYGM